jgi:hypothetical protein
MHVVDEYSLSLSLSLSLTHTHTDDTAETKGNGPNNAKNNKRPKRSGKSNVHVSPYSPERIVAENKEKKLWLIKWKNPDKRKLGIVHQLIMRTKHFISALQQIYYYGTAR